MQIMLSGVCSTENVCEGIDPHGNTFRIFGTFIYEGDQARFKDGTIVSGPIMLRGESCEVTIDDTTAILTIVTKVSLDFLALMQRAS